MSADAVSAQFESIYGRAPEQVYFAPGRVNIIGEHLDYNFGHVMPAALTLGTYLAVGPGRPGSVRLYSENRAKDGVLRCPVEEVERYGGPAWTKYPLGIIYGAMGMGAEVPPMDMYFSSDLPLEAGLSSSAAIMVATALAVTECSGLDLDRLAMARLVLRCERDYVGLSCGIMDPYCSLFGRRGEAVLIDCERDSHSYVPLLLGSHTLLIAHTGVPRQLVGSLFDTRSDECRAALDIARNRYPDLEHLCKLTPDQVDELAPLYGDARAPFRRMRHVVGENHRVLQAADALMHGNLDAVVACFESSHRSLREDYEVSCRELDAFQRILTGCEGVAAARMTGAGFGGCLVAIVEREAIEDVKARAGALYREETGLESSFYPGDAAEGARKLSQ